MGAFWLSTNSLGGRNANFLDAFQTPWMIRHDYSPEATQPGDSYGHTSVQAFNQHPHRQAKQ
jgi:hypothetical protein